MSDLRLELGYAHMGACPYLPGLNWAIVGAPARGLSDQHFDVLLDLGFRRMGSYVYTPRCGACQECVPLRIPVDRFVEGKSHARALRRNADVVLEIGEPAYSDSRLLLYRKFLQARYPTRESLPGPEEYKASFVYHVGFTREFRYTVEGRLIGIGIVDLTPQAASSVYFFFDPEEGRRSLGVYSALQEIAFCRRTGRRYLYLGFFVEDCRAMSYKALYRPHERRTPDGRWVFWP